MFSWWNRFSKARVVLFHATYSQHSVSINGKALIKTECYKNRLFSELSKFLQGLGKPLNAMICQLVAEIPNKSGKDITRNLALKP